MGGRVKRKERRKKSRDRELKETERGRQRVKRDGTLVAKNGNRRKTKTENS